MATMESSRKSLSGTTLTSKPSTAFSTSSSNTLGSRLLFGEVDASCSQCKRERQILPVRHGSNVGLAQRLRVHDRHVACYSARIQHCSNSGTRGDVVEHFLLLHALMSLYCALCAMVSASVSPASALLLLTLPSEQVWLVC